MCSFLQIFETKSECKIRKSNKAHGDAKMNPKILRLPTVKEITGLARSTIYLKISEGAFPLPISLGKRSIGWLESDIHDWIQQQIDHTRKYRKLTSR